MLVKTATRAQKASVSCHKTGCGCLSSQVQRLMIHIYSLTAIFCYRMFFSFFKFSFLRN